MPLYEYKCEKCGDLFEVRQKFADEPLTTHEKCGGPVERLISVPSLQFKGSGFYITDYGKGNSGKPADNGSSQKGESSAAAPASSGSSESSGSSTTASSSSSESKSSSSDSKSSPSKETKSTSSKESKSNSSDSK